MFVRRLVLLLDICYFDHMTLFTLYYMLLNYADRIWDCPSHYRTHPPLVKTTSVLMWYPPPPIKDMHCSTDSLQREESCRNVLGNALSACLPNIILWPVMLCLVASPYINLCQVVANCISLHGIILQCIALHHDG